MASVDWMEDVAMHEQRVLKRMFDYDVSKENTKKKKLHSINLRATQVEVHTSEDETDAAQSQAQESQTEQQPREGNTNYYQQTQQTDNQTFEEVSPQTSQENGTSSDDTSPEQPITHSDHQEVEDSPGDVVGTFLESTIHRIKINQVIPVDVFFALSEFMTGMSFLITIL